MQSNIHRDTESKTLSNAEKRRIENETFTQILYSYIRENKLAEAEHHLEDRVSFEELANQSSLHIALDVSPPNPEMIRLLLSKYAVKTKIFNFQTPIERAAKNKLWDIVNVFAEFPTDMNDKAKYSSAVEAAVIALKKDTLELLLFHPNISTSNTALHVAVECNMPSVVAILLKYGWKLDKKAQNKKTPLELASQFPDCLKVIRNYQETQREAEILTRSLYGYISADKLDEAQVLLKDKVSFQELPNQSSLHLALDCKSPNPRMIRLLLSKGADKTISLPEGSYLFTPIERAAGKCLWEVVDVFSEFPTDRYDNSMYCTAVHYAITRKKSDVALTLIKNPRNYLRDFYTDNFYYFLHQAAAQDLPQVFGELLERGFDPTRVTSQDQTAWDLAKQHAWFSQVFTNYNTRKKKLKSMRETFRLLVNAKDTMRDFEIKQHYESVQVDLKTLIEYIGMNARPEHNLQNLREFLKLVYEGLLPKDSSERAARVQLITTKIRLQENQQLGAGEEKNVEVAPEMVLLRACYKTAQHLDALFLQRKLSFFQEMFSPSNSNYRHAVTLDNITSFLDWLKELDKFTFSQSDVLSFYKYEFYLVCKNFVESLPQDTKQNKANATRLEDIFLNHPCIDNRIKIDILAKRWVAVENDLRIENKKLFRNSDVLRQKRSQSVTLANRLKNALNGGKFGFIQDVKFLDDIKLFLENAQFISLINSHLEKIKAEEKKKIEEESKAVLDESAKVVSTSASVDKGNQQLSSSTAVVVASFPLQKTPATSESKDAALTTLTPAAPPPAVVTISLQAPAAASEQMSASLPVTAALPSVDTTDQPQSTGQPAPAAVTQKLRPEFLAAKRFFEKRTRDGDDRGKSTDNGVKPAAH